MRISDLNEESETIKDFLSDMANEFFNIFWIGNNLIEKDVTFERFLEWMEDQNDYSLGLDDNSGIKTVTQAISSLNLSSHKEKKYLRKLWKHWYQLYQDV